MPRILTLDPSGTSITGSFLYEHWSQWQITSFASQNWLEQAENIENWLKKERVEILAAEVSRMWQKQRFTYHFDHLIKLVGCCEYLAQKYQIEYVPVSNHYRNRWEEQAKEGLIPGLVCQKEQGPKGRPKEVWYFHQQKLNPHEKDACLIFWIYWVKLLKKEWPWC